VPDDAPWLSSEELRAWILLMTLVESLPAALDAQLRAAAGINHFEYQMLAGLCDHPDGLRMSDLAAFATGSASRVSHAMGRLERRGLVRRTPDPDDPRAVRAHITAEGRRFMVEVAPGHVREARRLVFDVLTPAQVGQLERIAGRVVTVTAPDVSRLLREGMVPAFDAG
jgi:DNA-binding MarR family transcriptional regulator